MENNNKDRLIRAELVIKLSCLFLRKVSFVWTFDENWTVVVGYSWERCEYRGLFLSTAPLAHLVLIRGERLAWSLHNTPGNQQQRLPA